MTDTRSWTLEQLDHPGIPALLEYKKLSRLLTANGWTWLDTWARDGRFRPYFLPGGVVTGRWASTGGGALSVPIQVRPAAVADEGWRFVVADVAQLEPRVLAGMSGDPAMAEAARATDLYQGMVASGAVATRAEAKVGILGAMYGGTRGESGRMLPRLTRRYPRAIGLVEEAARAGERGAVVHTLLGRGSPVPTGSWAQRRPRPRRAGGRRRLAGGPRPPPPLLGPVHPQLRRPGHRRRVGAVLAGRSAQPALAAWATARCGSGRTWSSSCTTRSWCTPRRRLADDVAEEVRRAAAEAGPPAVRRLPGRLPARRRRRRVLGRRRLSPCGGRTAGHCAPEIPRQGPAMKLLVLGATGATGRLLVDQALDRGHEVVAYVRRPGGARGAARPARRRRRADRRAGPGSGPDRRGRRPVRHSAPRGVKDLFGTDLMRRTLPAVAGAMTAAGVRRLVLMSAYGVGDTAGSASCRPASSPSARRCARSTGTSRRPRRGSPRRTSTSPPSTRPCSTNGPARRGHGVRDMTTVSRVGGHAEDLARRRGHGDARRRRGPGTIGRRLLVTARGRGALTAGRPVSDREAHRDRDRAGA